jgi:hypothetical protein
LVPAWNEKFLDKVDKFPNRNYYPAVGTKDTDGWEPVMETKEVRLFLEPEVARALKMEVARREAKSVSEVVTDLVRQHLPQVEPALASAR